jgi:hypothetical protein
MNIARMRRRMTQYCSTVLMMAMLIMMICPQIQKMKVSSI